MSRTLNDHMEFDHVVQVHPDGTVTDGPRDMYAPDLYALSDDEGNHIPETDPDLIRQASNAGWELRTGHSGQHGYSGPCMHSSEFIGGGLEDYIRARPGLWVVVVVQEEIGEPDSWALCYREAP